MSKIDELKKRKKVTLHERAKAYCVRHGKGCQSTVIPPWVAGYRAAVRDFKKERSK